MAETLPIPCPHRQGADERHCSDDAVTLREPRSVSLRPGSPRRSVDPTSGHRAQLSMRTSLLISLPLLAACGGGVQPPELAPAGPRGPLPTAPAAPGAAPGPGPTTAAPAHRALIAADWALAGRAQAVTAPHAMVVSSHPLASEVGTDILRRGGNAVDAAVAVGFALAVVHPVAGNIGGGGFMVIRMRAGPVRALDYRETAPRRASHDMYVDSAGNVTPASLTGHLSVGVPGSVAGMFEAHRKFGKLPWRELLAPAIRLAREGYELDFPRSRQIGLAAERLGRFPASAAQFLVKGQEAPPGTRFVQPELARTLQLIADSGPRVFYRGSIAELIVQEMERGGGLLTHEDLARYRPKWRNPIRIAYRGYTIYTMPPPSGGGVTLAEILNVMEGYAPLPAFGSATLMHLQTEAMRRAYIDRNRYLGDPDFAVRRRPLGRHGDDALLHRGHRGRRRLLHDDPQQRLRERRHRHRGGIPAERRDGRFHVSAGEAQPVRADSGRGQCHRAGKADAVGDDALPRARPRGPAGARARLARRLAHPDRRVSGDQRRHRPGHAAPGRGGRAAPAPSGAAGRAVSRARGIRAAVRRLPRGDGPQGERVGLQDRGERHRPHRRWLGRRGRPPARRRCRGVLAGPLHRQGLVELQRDGGALRQHDVDVARRPRRGRAGARAH